ncbi:DNA-binding protein [Dickeya dadantii]|uniref:YmfL family putative regulatory protein n=1 Tax=Dickeya dadantii TaxID=204038 RepID=UPI001CF3C888|nr:YmfL family putative regulatory protein [Dickeya dadantii]MCA7012496.1 DNA-binding protein [Dickeya dadantii]
MSQENPTWQAEKQPDWVIAVARKIITGLPGGYADAAQWLGVTENALFNRLRADSNQIFPIGWLMVLQQAGGTTLFADAVSRQSNSVNVRLPSVDEIENGDVNVRLMEAIEFIGRHSELVRRATEDGVIDDDEKRAIDENSYNVIAKFQESIVLLYSVFCPPTDQTSPHITPHQRE